MNEVAPRSWKQIIFRTTSNLAPSDAELEEYSWLLMELGADGVETSPQSIAPNLEANQIRAFFQISEIELVQLQETATSCGLKCLSVTELQQRDWVRAAFDLHQPLQIGGLTVVPVEAPESAKPPLPNQIQIVPGTGFGTGSHESTQTAIEFLQLPVMQTLNPQAVLDLGTGSGVLAIAAVKLYGARVEATEIDASALDNARDNININLGHEQIRLTLGEFPAPPGQPSYSGEEPSPISISNPHNPSVQTFDLICANIYAEILIRFEPFIRRAAKPSGLVILCGIMKSLQEEVTSIYTQPTWQTLQTETKGNWVGLLLRKVN